MSLIELIKFSMRISFHRFEQLKSASCKQNRNRQVAFFYRLGRAIFSRSKTLIFHTFLDFHYSQPKEQKKYISRRHKQIPSAVKYYFLGPFIVL